MNSVILVGRLARDVETRQTANGDAVSRFTVAVDRREKDKADFISCVSFGKTAEFVAKYFAKGKPIAMQGEIRTGTYEKQDGTKVYTTDVHAFNVQFCPQAEQQKRGDVDGFKAVEEGFPF